MTYAARRDANHAAIRDGLRQAGRYVLDMASLPGAGFDLLCLKSGRVTFMEIKQPSKRSHLTANEIVTQQAVKQRGGVHVVVTTLEEALEATNG